MTWSNGEQNIVHILNNTFRGFSRDNLICEHKSYSSFDAYNSRYTCEIKKRNFESYHNFSKAGLILEKYKYDKLIEKAKQSNTEALYINLFKDKKIFIWNLSKMTNEGYDFKWHSMEMNKATFNSKENKIDKKVSLLKENTTI